MMSWEVHLPCTTSEYNNSRNHSCIPVNWSCSLCASLGFRCGLRHYVPHLRWAVRCGSIWYGVQCFMPETNCWSEMWTGKTTCSAFGRNLTRKNVRVLFSQALDLDMAPAVGCSVLKHLVWRLLFFVRNELLKWNVNWEKLYNKEDTLDSDSGEK